MPLQLNTTNGEEQLVWISGFHTFWFIGWPVLWYLISCVMQIKWHRFLPKQFIGQTPLHLPQVQLSLESGHTQASSHHKESNFIQVVSSSSFQSDIWNVWGRHQESSCGSMITTSVEEQSVWVLTEWVFLDFLVLDGRIVRFAGWHHSKKGRHQGCFCSWTLQIGKNS